MFKKKTIGLALLFIALAAGGVAFTQGKGKPEKKEEAPRKLEFAAADLAVATLRPLDQSK
jgi:hypothetical protein